MNLTLNIRLALAAAAISLPLHSANANSPVVIQTSGLTLTEDMARSILGGNYRTQQNNPQVIQVPVNRRNSSWQRVATYPQRPVVQTNRPTWEQPAVVGASTNPQPVQVNRAPTNTPTTTVNRQQAIERARQQARLAAQRNQQKIQQKQAAQQQAAQKAPQPQTAKPTPRPTATQPNTAQVNQQKRQQQLAQQAAQKKRQQQQAHLAAQRKRQQLAQQAAQKKRQQQLAQQAAQKKRQQQAQAAQKQRQQQLAQQAAQKKRQQQLAQQKNKQQAANKKPTQTPANNAINARLDALINKQIAMTRARLDNRRRQQAVARNINASTLRTHAARNIDITYRTPAGNTPAARPAPQPANAQNRAQPRPPATQNRPAARPAQQRPAPARPAAPNANAAKPNKAVAAKPKIATLACGGNSPFWSLQLNFRGNQLNTKAPKQANPMNGRITQQISRNNDKHITLNGFAGSNRINATLVKNNACSDGITKIRYPYAITAKLGNQSVKGCCK